MSFSRAGQPISTLGSLPVKEETFHVHLVEKVLREDTVRKESGQRVGSLAQTMKCSRKMNHVQETEDGKRKN